MRNSPTYLRSVWVLLLFFVIRPVRSGTSGIVDIDVEARPHPTFSADPSPVETAQMKRVPTANRSVLYSPQGVPSVSYTPPSIKSTPIVVQGVFKMKDLYQSGVRAYHEQDYEKAIRYFKAALELHDPYSSKFYYAETHGLLGVIYQFFYPVPNHLEMAKAEYIAALQIDPQTKTARKHLAEVSGKVR